MRGRGSVLARTKVPWGRGGVAPKWTRVNKGKGGGQNSGIFNERTFWMSPNLIKNKLCCMLMPQNLVKIIDYVHLLPKTKFSIYFAKYAPNKENSSSSLNFCFLIFFLQQLSVVKTWTVFSFAIRTLSLFYPFPSPKLYQNIN